MASSISICNVYQIKPTNAQKLRTVPRILGYSHCNYMGKALVFNPLHTRSSSCVGIGHMRVKVQAISDGAGSSIRGAGSRQYSSSYKAEIAKAAPGSGNPGGQLIVLVAGAGVVLAVAFALFKVAGKMFKVAISNVPSVGMPSGGVKDPLSAGVEVAKLERLSRARLNDMARGLRTLRIANMAGHNFGDDGMIFLAESLAYNQVAEEVDFSANGITAKGLKALADILPRNDTLKILHLSGNPIGDEGAQGQIWRIRGMHG